MAIFVYGMIGYTFRLAFSNRTNAWFNATNNSEAFVKNPIRISEDSEDGDYDNNKMLQAMIGISKALCGFSGQRGSKD